MLCRLEDGWLFDELKLTPRLAPRSAPFDPAAAITYRYGVDPAWLSAPLPVMRKESNPELRARSGANSGKSQQESYIWNSALLAHADARLTDLIAGFKVDTLFRFTSFDGSQLPRFRLYPDNDFSPTPWITNHWGWLSPDITVRKPPRAVRVGLIGDSTSHNNYAFHLQAFLNAWAQDRGLGVRFEVANTGRQGFGFDDGLATLKYELGPMGLDYVVEYFAPSFSLVPAQMAEFADFPPGVKPGMPPPEDPRPVPEPDFSRRELNTLWSYSALLRRLPGADRYIDSSDLLSEPRKPRVALHLPPDRDGRVRLADAMKYRYFAGLASRFDRFRALSETLGATPLVSTERLCVWDGMKLRTDKVELYRRLNGPGFWPFSYADLQQMLAAHNGTIEAWAEKNSVDVIDIAGRMPQDPGLCADPWHDPPAGQRMRAWLIFQQLMSRIDEDLRNHRTPRDNSDPSGVHPYLDKPVERIPMASWIASARAALASGSR